MELHNNYIWMRGDDETCRMFPGSWIDLRVKEEDTRSMLAWSADVSEWKVWKPTNVSGA